MVKSGCVLGQDLVSVFTSNTSKSRWRLACPDLVYIWLMMKKEVVESAGRDRGSGNGLIMIK